MTDAMMDFCPFDGGFSPRDHGLRGALADYCQRRWPLQTQKHVQRAFDLSVDQAKGLLRGQASLGTFEQVLREGGWRVAVPIIGAVIGHGLADFFTSETKRLNHEAEERQRRAARLAEAESWLRTDDPGMDDRPPGHGPGVADRAPRRADRLAS